jgi:AcrR family transcriptional regulator
MVQAILQAAAELFAQLGYARTTTNKIAERAGVSVGSLYQYFPNKDCLLASLLEQHHADVDEVVGATLRRLADVATPLEDCLRQFLTELMSLHERDPALTKALSAEVLRESPAGDGSEEHEHRHDQARHVVATLAARPDVRRGDHAVMAAVLGETTARLTRWSVHDAPAALERTSLLEEMVQLLVRYLRS